MATDPTIRLLFPKDDDAPNTLDAAAIIRRSRARRLPKRLAIGGVSTLAVAGIVVASLQGVTTSEMSASQVEISAAESPEDLATPSTSPSDADSLQTTSGAAGSSAADRDLDQSGHPMTFSSPSGRGPAETINQCGEPLADITPHMDGLTITAEFPATARVADGSVAGVVTLTNTGDTAVVGRIHGVVPTVILSKDGVALWHTNGGLHVTSLPKPSTVKPGASVDYDAVFWPVACTAADEAEGDQGIGMAGVASAGFGSKLPTVSPGSYQLSVLMDFTGSDDDLVSGPLSSIELQ